MSKVAIAHGSPKTTSPTRLIAMVSALVLGTSACGLATQDGGSNHASSAVVPLVVYSAQGYDSAETKAFQAATGIPVRLDDDSTGPLLTKIAAERNNPKWGLLWVDGAEAFASLDHQGLLLRGWAPPANFNPLGHSLLPADRSYIPTGITMAGTLVYNSNTLKAPPTSWNQLLAPKWRGAVGMNDPAVSGPTYPFVAGMFSHLGGVSAGQSYFEKLKANGLQVFQTNGDTLHALEGGQIKIALIQSSAGLGAAAKDPAIKTSFLAPVTALPSAIGIDAHAPKAVQAEAKRFVTFVLSPRGQKVMQTGDPNGDSLYWPVIEGIAPPQGLPPLGSIPAQTVNPYKWGAREAQINSWFTANVVQ